MKKLFVLSLTSLLFFFGCDQVSDVTSPLNESADQQLKVTSVLPLSDDAYVRNPYLHREDKFIDDSTSEVGLCVSKLIDGDIGGEIIFDETYIDSSGRHINIYAQLQIPEDAFQGLVTIYMQPNPEDVTIQLFPEMAFTKDVKLDFWFQGIDAQDLGYNTSGNVDFVYFADNGDVELIENNVSQVDIAFNKIYVLNAKLFHFSRYGWVR
ncbi:MAG: hypothetical protein ACW99A_21695 [Candidatus Kariarchaeaceae archaeon]